MLFYTRYSIRKCYNHIQSKYSRHLSLNILSWLLDKINEQYLTGYRQAIMKGNLLTEAQINAIKCDVTELFEIEQNSKWKLPAVDASEDRD